MYPSRTVWGYPTGRNVFFRTDVRDFSDEFSDDFASSPRTIAIRSEWVKIRVANDLSRTFDSESKGLFSWVFIALFIVWWFFIVLFIVDIGVLYAVNGVSFFCNDVNTSLCFREKLVMETIDVNTSSEHYVLEKWNWCWKPLMWIRRVSIMF